MNQNETILGESCQFNKVYSNLIVWGCVKLEVYKSKYKWC
jgi:hypothetical protein